MASTQTINALRQQVEKMIITNTITPAVKEAMSDTQLIKSVITTVAGAFNAANPNSVALEMILPQSMKSELEDFLKKEINGKLCKGLKVEYVKGISNGFKIGPKDGGYMISFTDEDFDAMIGGYLRPATRRILFGE
jgi:V/A-type H+-transporting ATPase subunit E